MAYQFSTSDVVDALIREYLGKHKLIQTSDAYSKERPKHPNSISKREVLRAALGVESVVQAAKAAAGPAGERHVGTTLELWVADQMAQLNNFCQREPSEVPSNRRPTGVVRSSSRDEHDSASAPEPSARQSAGRNFPTKLPSPAQTTAISQQTSALPSSNPSSRPAPAPFVPTSSSALANARSGNVGASLPPAPLPSSLYGTSSNTRVPSSGYSSGRPSMPLNRRAVIEVCAEEDDDADSPPSAPTPSNKTRSDSSSFPFPQPPSSPSAPLTSSYSLAEQPHSSIAPEHQNRNTHPSTSRPSTLSNSPAPSHRHLGQPSHSVPNPDRNSDLGPSTRGSSSATRASSLQHPAVMLMEDIDDDFGGGGMERLSMGGFIGRGAPAAKTVPKGAPLSQELRRSIDKLMWGSQGSPPPSWHQGFYFNKCRGLEFGLVQASGGPCGVLAAVQAHILAGLRNQDGSFITSPSPAQQQKALACALSELLWACRSGPTALLVLPTSDAGESGGGSLSTSYDRLSRAVAGHSMASLAELQGLIQSSLSVWMQPRGWGIFLLLMSLLATRGVATIIGDMDEKGNSLMGMHGYCTQELVNLILTGTAVSNVFDGVRDLDATILQGIKKPCRLGMLTLFEWYKYVEVGTFLKDPELPIWVVCSESHFTILFGLDVNCMTRKVYPFDLIFYDELAVQEVPVRLTVSLDPHGGWTRKVGDTIGDRGKCEGQNIPPLECVIETRWSGVTVSWNGAEPIL